jgi:hypothetical protein
MSWLEESTLWLDNVAVVGSLVWYDYSAADPTLPHTGQEYPLLKKALNNDARYIDWPWTDQEFAGRLGEGLSKRLEAVEAESRAEAVLVATHVPICEEQMVRKPHDSNWGIQNAFFGNLTVGRQVLAMPKVRAIVSGHTHLGRQADITRPDMPMVRTAVNPSDYGVSAYLVIDTTNWRIR